MSLLETIKNASNKGFLVIKQKTNKIRTGNLNSRYILGGFIILAAVIGVAIYIGSTLNKNTAKAAGLDCLVQNIASVTYSGLTSPLNSNQLQNNVNQCSSSSISITKLTQSPKVFKNGTQYYYNVEFQNTGSVDLKEVVVTDTANSNLAFAGTTCATTLTDENGSATLPFATSACSVDNAGGTFTFTLTNNLVAGQRYKFRVLANIKSGAATGVQYPNNIVINGKVVSTNQPVTSNSSDVVSAPTIDINKTTQTPAAFRKGAEFYYSIDFSNTSTVKLVNTTITDQLPAEVDFVDTTCANVLLDGTGNPFTIPTSSCSISGSTLTFTMTNPLLANQQFTFRIRAKIKATAPDTGTFTNNVSIVGQVKGDDGTLGEQVTDQSSSGVQPIQIFIEKTVSKLNVKRANSAANVQGGVFSYTITYGNLSTQNLTNLTVIDSIPSQYNFLNDGTCAGCTYNSGLNQLTWTGLSLLAGESKTLTFNVQVKDNVPIQNNVCNIAQLVDGSNSYLANACNNIVDYGLTISKTPSAYVFEIDPTHPENTNYTYYLDYENTQNTPLTGVYITDQLNPNINFVTGSCTGAVTCTYDAPTRTLRWNVGNMAAKAKGKVNFKVNFAAGHVFATGDSVPNTAIIHSNETPNDDDSAAVKVRFTNPDIDIQKTVPKTYYNNGDQVTYTITFANTKSTPLTGVYITDILDSRLYFTSATGTNGNYTYDSATRTVRWNIGNLAVGESRTYTLTVTVNGNGVINNKATIFSNETDSDYSDVNIIITPEEFAIKIDKRASSAHVRRGETYTYTLNYFNPSDTTNLTGVVITDPLDSNIDFVTGSCKGDLVSGVTVTCSYNSTNRTLTWNIGNMVFNQTGTVTFDVTVKTTAALGTIPNTATIDSNETEPDQDPAPVDVVDYGLTISKTPSAYVFEIDPTHPENTNYTYYLDYENTQNTPLTGVYITDQLNPNINFVTGSCTGAVTCTYDAPTRTLRWNVGNMAAKAKGKVNFKVNFAAGHVFATGDSVPNTAIIHSNETPNDDDSAAVKVRFTNPDIDIQKTVPKTYYNNGDQVTYTITFANTKSTPLTGVYITDILDSRLYFTSATGTNGNYTYDSATRTVRWNIGNLAVGESRTYTLTVTVNGNGVINNKATIFSNETDSDYSDVNIIITPEEFAIKIDKRASSAHVRRGETYTYTLNYFNPSDTTNLTGVVITDPLDSNIDFVTGSCKGDLVSGVTVTCSYNSTNRTLTWNIGNMVFNQTGTVTFDVTVKTTAALGTIPNTATIDSNETEPDQDPAPVDVVDYKLSIHKTPSQYLFEINPANPAATQYTYYLDYSNDQTTSLTGVVINDTLDNRINFVNGSCAGSVTCTYNTATRTITWNVGNMAAGATGRVEFKVVFSGTYAFAKNESVPNTAIIDSNETGPNQDSAYVAVRYTNPDINIDKQVNPIYYNNGDKVVYPIVFANTKSTPLTGVYITDILDSRLNFSSCTGGCTYNAATRTVRWNIGNLAVGESRTYTLTVTVNGNGVINNKATIYSNETEPDFDDVNIIITPIEFKIKIVKYASTSHTRRGSSYTYTLDYFNPSDTTALTGVVITDPLDSKIDFVTGSCHGDLITNIALACSYNFTTKTLSWNVGNMTAGQTGRVTFDVTVKSDAALSTIPNTATIDSNETEPDQDSAFVDIVNYNLSIVKTASQNLFEINPANPAATSYTYTLDYSNQETTPLTGVVITDTLDNRIEFVPSTCTGTIICTYNTATRTITWNVGNMTAGQTSRVAFNVNFASSHTFAQNETIPNTAIIDSNETGPADSTYPVAVKYTNPNINITKDTTPMNRNLGDQVVYTITFANTSNVALTGVYINDILESRLDYVSCTSNCTYTTSTRTVRWNIGNLAIGESRTYYLTVTPNATGTIPNFATIYSNETQPDQDDATIVVAQPTYSISITKSASVSVAKRGDTYTYTLDYSNPSTTTALTGVVITDVLDSKIEFVPSTCQGDLISGTSISCSYNATTRTLSWNVGNLAIAQPGKVKFNVQINANAALSTIPNTAVIDSNETGPAQSSVPVDIVDYNLGITKTVSDFQFIINKNNPGATEFVYTLSYVNVTNQPLTNVVITDTLENRLVYVSCSNSCTYDAATRKLTWTFPTLAGLGQGQVNFRVKLNNSYVFTPLETILNTAIIDSDQTDPKQSSVSVVVKYFDVSITKATSKSLVNIGDTYTYTVNYKNETQNVLTNAILTDILSDTRISYVAGSCSANCTYNSSTRALTWQLGQLSGSQTGTVTFNVIVQNTVNYVSTIINKATITTSETGPRDATVNVSIAFNPIRTGGAALPYALAGLAILALGAGGYSFYRSRKRIKINIVNKIK